MSTVRIQRGFWPKLDQLAHAVRLCGPVARYLCDRADLAYGLTKAEIQAYRGNNHG